MCQESCAFLRCQSPLLAGQPSKCFGRRRRSHVLETYKSVVPSGVDRGEEALESYLAAAGMKTAWDVGDLYVADPRRVCHDPVDQVALCPLHVVDVEEKTDL